MRKEKESIVDGRRIKVTQLGFEEGMDLLVLLTKTLGPSLGALAADSSQIAPALSEFAKQLNNQDLKSVISTLAKSTRVNREGDKWPILEPEVDLAGEYGFMFKWLGFALETNYGGFLEGNDLRSQLQSTVQAFQSQPTSDGKSIES